VRVPTVVISPLIPKLPSGLVDHTIYDHASILATLERLFDFGPLTDRDRHANDLLHLASLSKPRLCPEVLNDPAPLPVAEMAPMTAAEQERMDQQPLSGVGTRAGLLLVLRKMEVALSSLVSPDKIAALPKFSDMKTLGDARRYSSALATLLEDFRATRTSR
jgi:phospholipase C